MQSGCSIDSPCVSVIVPVYKAEEFLADCVESILKQTYKNIEIYLVDDGSPDGCGGLCDYYAQKDERVHVIHKENGGLSSARNAALSQISGDYVAFVDSDDAIATDMIEYMIEAIQRNNAQISVCGFTKWYVDGRKELDSQYNHEVVYSNEDVLKVFLPDDKIGSQACNKIFKTELFKDVEFPCGRVYEDIAIMHHVFAKAKTIVCLPEGKYYYKLRDDSISFTQNARWAYGLYRAFADRYEFSVSQKDKLSIDGTVIEIILAKACGFAISGVRFWKEKTEPQNEYLNDAVSFLKDNISKILKNKKLTFKRKVKAILIAFCPYIYLKSLRKG